MVDLAARGGDNIDAVTGSDSRGSDDRSKGLQQSGGEKFQREAFALSIGVVTGTAV